MELISNILLIAGALGAAFYCFVLSRRLNRFTNLDKGVGGAIAVLSAQVDDMTRILGRAQGTASGSTATLQALTERAEDVSRRLELMVASMHDLPAVPDRDCVRPAAPQPKIRPVPEPEKPVPVEETSTGESALFRSSRAWRQEAAE